MLVVIVRKLALLKKKSMEIKSPAATARISAGGKRCRFADRGRVILLINTPCL